MDNSSIKHQSFVYKQLDDQTVLFQTIQFCIIGNEGVLCIQQNSSIRFLVSYPGRSFGEGANFSTEIQSVYSTAPIYLATGHSFGRILPLYKDAVGVFFSSSRLEHRTLVGEILPLYRNAVGVFYSPSRLGKKNTCRWGSYLSTVMQSTGLCMS